MTVTTVIAILAAIAGPYYRSVDLAGQRRLLIFWPTILVCTALSFWQRLRGSLALGAKLRGRFVTYAATDSWSVRERPSLLALGVIGVTVWTFLSSYTMGTEVQSRSFFFSPLYVGFLIGSAVAGLIFGSVRRPVYICDEGVPLANGQIAPWKYIRYAAWTPESPNVMKLRRYDGDVYLEVSPRIRDDVAAFVREKIGVDIKVVEGN